MTRTTFHRHSRTAAAALAAVASLACGGEPPPTDQDMRIARAAASGLPGTLRPDWGPAGPQGIACAPRMHDARDSTVRLTLSTQQVLTETARHRDTTFTRRWAEGQYVVTPAGRYGAEHGATLRVDCSRGAATAAPGA